MYYVDFNSPIITNGYEVIITACICFIIGWICGYIKAQEE